ncbi:MAG: DUF927 domain-containing protein [Kiloniellaceae bacterium]|nr:DUF927 domain-containing protein [Kiloniellaceae bacterium]
MLVVEGEKAADAAAALFPTYVSTTSPNGAKAADKADWSPLAGRTVVIWPDNDHEGQAYAKTVARLAAAAGALSIGIVSVPADFPEKWDLADPLPVDWQADQLATLVEAAGQEDRLLEFLDPAASVCWPFKLTTRGVEYGEETDDGDMDWKPVCSRLEVLADTRDGSGQQWGRLLRVIDRDGAAHEWAMPMAMLAGDGSSYRETLLALGLSLSGGAKSKTRLHDYIAQTAPPARLRCVPRIGWHGGCYVLPDRTYGAGGEPVRLQTESPLDHAFVPAGDLAGWQREIGSYCVGNSRLAFAAAVALAAPLLPFVSQEGGGFHLRGPSSVGKTTALRIAGGMWGGGSKPYIRTWRATANGLEGTAQAHNHALLCLDELGQVDGREAGAAAYMLANGEGKSRARKDGMARPPARWQLLFLSTGELSLADKLNEAGKRIQAGQETRLVDLQADAGAGLGLFEDLHGMEGPAALANRLQQASGSFYGTPIRAFVAKVANDSDAIAEKVREAVERFVSNICPNNADGQVRRVAQRFGLVAAAGELATVMGILPWSDGESTGAAERCFRDWLEQRGGVLPAEEREALERVRDFLARHGESRFTKLDGADPGRPTINRAGFSRQTTDGSEFLIFPPVFKGEIAAGLDPQSVARVLRNRGYLLPDSAGKSTTPVRLPGSDGPVRVYRVSGRILEGDANA